MSSRTKAIAFGLAAMWFYLLMGVALLAGIDGPRWLPEHLSRYWILYAGIIVVVSWIVFVIDAFRNPRVPEGKRRLWAAVLFFAGPWAMPFYFWFYVRPVRRLEAADGRA